MMPLARIALLVLILAGLVWVPFLRPKFLIIIPCCFITEQIFSVPQMNIVFGTTVLRSKLQQFNYNYKFLKPQFLT